MLMGPQPASLRGDTLGCVDPELTRVSALHRVVIPSASALRPAPRVDHTSQPLQMSEDTPIQIPPSEFSPLWILLCLSKITAGKDQFASLGFDVTNVP